MLNSMYSGISGLNANQRKLDVIGNNIANSGTTAFKASSVTFQDSMYQSIKASSSPSLNLGGTNPTQVGLGVSVQGINVNMNQGSLQPTGRPLDVAIDGKGYFVVSKGPETGSITVSSTYSLSSNTMESYYSRDGAFKLDPKGNLLNSNGYRIMGYMVTDDTKTSPQYVNADSANLHAVHGTLKPLTIPETVDNGTTKLRIQSYSIEKDGMVKAVLSDGSTTVLGQVAMVAFNNEIGLEQVGQNMYIPSTNSGEPIARTGKIKSGDTTTVDNSKAYGDMVQGSLEMSNVDLAVQFTDMIIASRSFQANSKIISTGDEILQELVNLKR